jgi:putative acetyltransferase
MIIRTERESDFEPIAAITKAAFATEPHSQQTEQFIIAALRAAGALCVSLVAEEDSRIVGHVAFSRVEISDGTPDWYGLGPVSVTPELQRRGIGSALIRAGLAALQNLGARGCALVGDPAYYRRFGFRQGVALTLDGVPPENFLILPLVDGPEARGRVVFHDAFWAAA